jgi:hypothetical protein
MTAARAMLYGKRHATIEIKGNTVAIEQSSDERTGLSWV